MANVLVQFDDYDLEQEIQKQPSTYEVYSDISLQSKYGMTTHFANNDAISSTFRVSRSANVKAVQNAIENIFNFFPGERILYPEFGSRLKFHLYNGITTFNVEQVVAEVYSNAEQFDERIVIDDILVISTDEDTDDNTVTLQIVYHIAGLSKEHYTYEYSYVTGN